MRILQFSRRRYHLGDAILSHTFQSDDPYIFVPNGVRWLSDYYPHLPERYEAMTREEQMKELRIECENLVALGYMTRRRIKGSNGYSYQMTTQSISKGVTL